MKYIPSIAFEEMSGSAKNGAPSAAAPKVFFRYYVNSSTDEKSGVMLAEPTWTARA